MFIVNVSFWNSGNLRDIKFLGMAEKLIIIKQLTVCDIL